MVLVCEQRSANGGGHSGGTSEGKGAPRVTCKHATWVVVAKVHADKVAVGAEDDAVTQAVAAELTVVSGDGERGGIQGHGRAELVVETVVEVLVMCNQ